MSIFMHGIFVCWGNICRSPAAEATFRKVVNESDMAENLTCDSVGTINSHAGNPPDPRMQRAAKARGIETGGRSRMVTKRDFEEADWLLTMDEFNFSELNQLCPDDRFRSKIRPFCDFVSSSAKEVPDPYYGGASGFEVVLDLLEDGCIGLLSELSGNP